MESPASRFEPGVSVGPHSAQLPESRPASEALYSLGYPGNDTTTPGPEPASNTRAAWFASTHWSVVLAAAQNDLRTSSLALEKLCETYWKPLFIFARRLGHNEHDAQDLTQAFFEQFLQKGYIRAADPRRGRFRSFLLTSFRHFLTKEWAKTRTAKRGAGVTFVSFEELTPGENAQLEQANKLTPEAAYDRQWALRVFDVALGKLRQEFAAADKQRQFAELKPFLSRLGTHADYQLVAEQCGMNPGAVAVAVRRLRVRYGELLRAEIANTVASPQDIEDELGLLTNALIG